MKVAVLMGGQSFERDFSLASGKRVCEALEQAGHQVIPLDTTTELVPTLRAEKPDVAYIALHGKHGEDGTIQSLLEFLDIPFVGSTADVCRKTWNKATLEPVMTQYSEMTGIEPVSKEPVGYSLAKDAFSDMGAATALDMIEDRIPGGYPLAVKPARGGSAMGVHRVENVEELAEAMLDAFNYDNDVLVQQWIDGVELAVSILGEGEEAHALPPVEIVPLEGLYTTAARQSRDAVEFFVPVRPESLSQNDAEAEAIRAEIERAALEAYRAYGVRDLGRVDMVWDGAQARILEVDVSPGMTEMSLLPAACEASGISLSAMLDSIVKQYARG